MIAARHCVPVAIVIAGLAVGSPESADAASACRPVHADRGALRARVGNLERENTAADRQKLSRFRSLTAVRRFTRLRFLIPVRVATPSYRVVGVAPPFRVTRPWTRRFIEDVSDAFHRRFGTPLRITSLTRTAETQQRLRGVNANAAPARGLRRSSHLTGAAVDISKRSLGRSEVRWLRSVLHRLTAARVLSAIEEFAQPHFHVLVFRRYEPAGRDRIRAIVRSVCYAEREWLKSSSSAPASAGSLPRALSRAHR